MVMFCADVWVCMYVCMYVFVCVITKLSPYDYHHTGVYVSLELLDGSYLTQLPYLTGLTDPYTPQN
ncbi:hypothetical protein EON63_18530, partial [archaeon]